MDAEEKKNFSLKFVNDSPGGGFIRNTNTAQHRLFLVNINDYCQFERIKKSD